MRFAKHSSKLPSLLRQETAATQQLLVLLLRLYTHDRTGPSTGSEGFTASASATPTASPWRSLAVRHLRALSEAMVARYIQLSVEVERARMMATPAYMHSAPLPIAGTGPATGGAAAAAAAIVRARAGSLGHFSGSGATTAADGAQAGGASDLLDGAGAIDRDIFREAAAYGPLVSQLLASILSWEGDQFTDNLPWVYPLLTGLIVAGNMEIRALVAGVFETRLRPAALQAAAPQAEGGAAGDA